MRKRLTSMLSAISPTCRESVRLMSAARDHPLSPSRRLGLRIHLLLCGFCRRYQHQIEFLKTALEADSPSASSQMPDEAKERMKELIQQTASKGPATNNSTSSND